MYSFEENEKKQKYADILSLGGFNAFFGDKNNKDEVIKILNVSKDYDIPPVYLIGLMGTAIDHPNKELWKDRYIFEYTCMEKDTHDLLGETIVIIFAEFGNFDKREDECVTRQDRMLYMLKNLGKFDTPPVWSSQEKYDGILAALCIDDYDEDKREKYESDMKTIVVFFN